MSGQLADTNVNVADEIDLEWEEWDGSSPFLHHCIAGSIAGVAEHTLLYPVDTVKTHMQAYCSTCPNNPVNIVSPNAATKPICTGPPVAAKLQTAANATANATANQGHAHPNGMWSTMSNLINHGHSQHHAVPSPININKHASRKSGTLTLSSNTAPSYSGKGGLNNSTNMQKTKGYSRLWRGVQTMTTGCIPAHALYFSSYEYTKSLLSTTTISPTTGMSQTQLNTFGASVAGAISALCHDVIMTPMDTIKQRMQLGHYQSMGNAFREIMKSEGWNGLYRSFGITVLTNIPYGMIMVSTNEFLRNMMMDAKREKMLMEQHQQQVLDIQTTMLAGCGAGMVAAAVTSPLDRVKTRLQTQRLINSSSPTTTACPKAAKKLSIPHYTGINDAFTSIIKEEGYQGLWRGLSPRLLTHTPAVAISWTSYELAKQFLHNHFE